MNNAPPAAASRQTTTIRRALRPPIPTLRLTPYAWAKLVYLRDAGPTEIGGFGLAARGDLLLVEDVALVRQQGDLASVAFDDASVADLFDRQVDGGRRPEEFARVWVHTHPGDSAEPSLVDEETFARAFGGCDWAVMLIVARGGAAYGRLRFAAGPGGSLELPVGVAYDVEFPATRRDAWQAEYATCVRPVDRVEPPAWNLPPTWDDDDVHRWWEELPKDYDAHADAGNEIENLYDDDF